MGGVLSLGLNHYILAHPAKQKKQLYGLILTHTHRPTDTNKNYLNDITNVTYLSTYLPNLTLPNLSFPYLTLPYLTLPYLTYLPNNLTTYLPT